MRIAFLILPNTLVTSFTNAYELLFAAKVKARSERSTLAQSTELIKIALSDKPQIQPSGLALHPDQVFDFAIAQCGMQSNVDQNRPSREIFDMIFVPALWRDPRPIVRRHPEIPAWLRWQYEHGAILNGTGTGVCFLAEAGVLDHKPATTHWHHLDAFATDYPQVELKRQHFITSAGKVYCAASSNAQTDLVLHHVHRFFGKGISEHLSHHFSHEVRQPYDRLRFDQENNNNHPDEPILQAQLWLQNNLSKTALSMHTAAELVNMSPRTFARRFRLATNTSPLQYLQGLRHQEAKDLLKSTNLSISEIAFRVGYQDISYFTKLFKQFSSITPKQYRTTVRAKLFSNSD